MAGVLSEVCDNTMGKCPTCGPSMVRAAKAMGKAGISRREAARKLGVSYSGLTTALTRKKCTKETRGRKVRMTKQLQSRIVRFRNAVKKKGQNPTASFVRRKLRLINPETRMLFSRRTITRVLRKNGNRYLRRPRKGTLTKTDKKLRVEWAKKITKRKLAAVDCFIDCHAVEMPTPATPVRSLLSWRAPSEGEEDWAQKAPTKYMAPKVKLCGGIGNGKIMFLATYSKFNADNCVNIFRKHLLPALKRNGAGGRRSSTIVVDGDGSFTSGAFVAFLKKHRIKKFQWQAKSPDMNPIENLWSRGNEMVEEAAMESRKWRNGALKNAKNLKAWEDFTLKIFRKIPKKYIRKILDPKSLARRAKRIVEKKGSRINT